MVLLAAELSFVVMLEALLAVDMGKQAVDYMMPLYVTADYNVPWYDHIAIWVALRTSGDVHMLPLYTQKRAWDDHMIPLAAFVGSLVTRMTISCASTSLVVLFDSLAAHVTS